MSGENRELYEYIVEKIPEISAKWFGSRQAVKGSIYSLDADSNVEKMLRDQHQLTILTVASAFLGESEDFRQNMNKWGDIVAKSRVDMQTPIYEVLEALSKTRILFWEFVEEFSRKYKGKLESEDIFRWSAIVHSAFDKLSHEFTRRYYDLTNSRLLAQQQLINEVSSPVIPIIRDVAVLPIIGDIDTQRAKTIIENIPEKVLREQVGHLFIDLSGVPIIDTMVAHQLFQLTSVLRLLGVKATFSGIRPEVAQTASQLGLKSENVRTYSTLKQALQEMGIHYH